MSRNPNGYGMLGYDGNHYWAHRLMCHLAHGEAPSQDHEVAHLCGKGHEGCVNPNHLAWKTRGENHLDKREHGTLPERDWKFIGKVTPEQAAEIRALKGHVTQAVLADRFNVSEPTIRDIQLGRSHRPNPKIRGFTPDEEAKLRAAVARNLRIDDIAILLGRTYGSVHAKIYKLGLKGPRVVA